MQDILTMLTALASVLVACRAEEIPEDGQWSKVNGVFEKESTPWIDPETPQDLRKAMRKDPYYQCWAALRRNTMEQRQQSGLQQQPYGNVLHRRGAY